jgi:hypothetical protein
MVTCIATAASTAARFARARSRSLRICSYAGTPAAVTLASTAPRAHHPRPAGAEPACMPNHVAKATAARLMAVVR